MRLKNEEIRRLRKQAEARRSEEDRSREEARRREMIKSHGGTSFGGKWLITVSSLWAIPMYMGVQA